MIVRAEPQEITRAIQLLFQPGDTVELRCLAENDRVVNGYFRDWDKLQQEALRIGSCQPPVNCYVCLNPVDPQLYGRRAEQLGPARKGSGTKDSDIICRRWLLVDLDPVRPAGVSATDPQKQAAQALADQVYRYLVEQLRLPRPVVADSGNGMHLLLGMNDLPNDPQSALACEGLLKHLAQRFSDALVKVDLTTSNAARISCLYGTIKAKGSHTAEQPHRCSRLLSIPDPLERVTLQQLLAISGQQPSQAQPAPAGQASGWDIEQLLEQRGIEFERTDNYTSRSGESATLFALPTCPWDPSHDNKAAYIIQWQSGAIAAGCHHDGCKGKDWVALKQLWGLPAAGGIQASDIILPATPRTSQTSQQCYTTNQTPLQSYIEPPTPAPECFYGPLGQIAQGIANDTEAAPIAVLACSLTLFGNAVGRCCYVTLDQPHFPKLYVALVGATGSGRKGTADYQARQIIDSVDPTAALLRHGGLSTGEGLLEILDQNRDGIYPRPACFIEREFCAVFRRAERKGNTLSAYVRDAWDGSPLENTIKAKPLRIDDHHISLCAHITPAELKKLLLSVDIANGYSNRILWFFCRRAERRPRASGFQPGRFRQQIQQLQSALAAAREQYSRAGQPVELAFSAAAQQLWDSRLYAELDIDSDQDTQLILMTSRQAQQACRLALILALADGRTQIEPQHLTAASAIVAYVYESLDYVFSQSWWGDSGCATDPAGMAPKVLQALQAGPLTRWQIRSAVLHRHHTAREINQLRDLLLQQGRIRVEQQPRQELWGLPEV